MEIELDHVRIHGHDLGYRMAGQGPAILLIHGIAGSSTAWRDVMPALSRRYTVIAPDLLGHGDSAKPTGDYSLGACANILRDFLGIVGISRVTVVGQSFGGGVAMQFCYQSPEACERLVLVDSGGLGREVSWLLRFMTYPGSEYLMPVIFPSFVREPGDAVNRLLRSWGIRVPRLEEMWRSYSSLTDVANRQSFVRTIRSVIDPGGQAVSAMDRLYLTEQVPTMIVWGQQDAIIPVSHAYAAHDAIPGSRLEVIPDAGHFPQVENPDAFLDVLMDFMETTTPGQVNAQQFHDMLRDRAASLGSNSPQISGV
jgi:pimeloyl-ACP methyl ester carboxylesterase